MIISPRSTRLISSPFLKFVPPGLKPIFLRAASRLICFSRHSGSFWNRPGIGDTSLLPSAPGTFPPHPQRLHNLAFIRPFHSLSRNCRLEYRTRWETFSTRIASSSPFVSLLPSPGRSLRLQRFHVRM